VPFKTYDKGRVMMHLFHKWKTIAESDKWRAGQCQKCGKIKWVDKWGGYGGYQPRPLLPGEKYPEPPAGGSHIYNYYSKQNHETGE
jgi:hypothetical protein